MRLSSIAVLLAVFVAAGIAAVAAATAAVALLEDRTEIDVRDALDVSGRDWAEVQADGLRVVLSGTAPSEADRFAAITTVTEVVDAARVIDQMSVAPSQDLAAPQFTVEILRNEAGLSLIGLIPAGTDRDALAARISGIGGGGTVRDFLETADHPAPETWDAALDYALAALERLPRSKISASADRVAIEASVDSFEAKQRLDGQLARMAPDGLRVALDISAPRPVIAPFSLRFVIDEAGARFDSCSADTEQARAAIVAAAAEAGVSDKVDCRLGLGVPSASWGRAAAEAIGALAEIGGGSVTFSNADVSLIAAEGTPAEGFARAVGELERALPEPFSLTAVLPQPPEAEGEVVPEFVATLSPEGLVQLRGLLPDPLSREAAESFARARFGMDSVRVSIEYAESLPEGWPVRVLAALEALAALEFGSVAVSPDHVDLRGETGNREARAAVTQLLSTKLGEAADFTVNVAYREELDPVASLPTPEECVAQIQEVLAERKITFEPGSVTIDADAGQTIIKIAAILRECPEMRLEVAGHTDSQGREEMNLQLSQDRAEAVIAALRAQRLSTAGLTAKGYGETRPIGDNETEEGRELNRRIEFTLFDPEAAEAEAAGEETAEAGTAESETAETGEEPSGE